MVPSERILVVEDERDTRFVIESLLRAHGYEVEEVRSGEEAIARLHQERFDAIVLDYRMPGLNGIDVARRLQRFVVDTPVVLFSAPTRRPGSGEAERGGDGT